VAWTVCAVTPEAERVGDNGARASVELRTPQLLMRVSPHFEQSFVFAFVDDAWLQTIEPLPDQIAVFHLASYGLGFSNQVAWLSTDLDGAHVINQAM